METRVDLNIILLIMIPIIPIIRTVIRAERLVFHQPPWFASEVSGENSIVNVLSISYYMF